MIDVESGERVSVSKYIEKIAVGYGFAQSDGTNVKSSLAAKTTTSTTPNG